MLSKCFRAKYICICFLLPKNRVQRKQVANHTIQSNQIGLDGWWFRGVKDKCFSKSGLRKHRFVAHQLLITVKWIVASTTSEHSYNWLMCTLCPGVESLVMMSLAASCHIQSLSYILFGTCAHVCVDILLL